MGRPEKPVHAADSAIAAFARELRALRTRAGSPTYRDMARNALFSASVLSSAASGTRLPTLPVTLGFAAACGGDLQEWRQRWVTAANMQPVTRDGPRSPLRRDPSPADHPVPSQLPLRPGGMFGRRSELRQLEESGTRPIIIHGPIGVGKSNLALHHAYKIAADAADGQLYADLGQFGGNATDADQLVTGFLSALGFSANILPPTRDQRTGLYRSILATRRLVVLLDNVRSERQIRPLLSESATSTTLIVSRSSLLGIDGARRVPVSLPSDDVAESMLVAMLPAHTPAEEKDIARIATLCGGIPLALGIVARRLTVLPHVTLSSVIAELGEPNRALEWLHAGDVSLRTRLDLAFRALDSPSRDLLVRIAGAERGSVVVDRQRLQQADRLADLGFLHRCSDFGNRFTVPTLIRAFVTDACRPGAVVGQSLVLSMTPAG